MEKVVLLDVDGVVFNNKFLFQKVSNRIVKYVSNTYHKNLTHNQAVHLNSVLYTTHGHTLRGLRTLYDDKKRNYRTDNFNNRIYDNNTIELLKTYLKYTKPSREFTEFAEYCNKNKIRLYLFSNAPYKWCYEIANNLNLLDYMPPENILTSSHILFEEEQLLKPDIRIYDKVYNYINKDSSSKMYFIDDSFINLLPLVNNQLWTPILWNPKDGLETVISTASNTNDIKEILFNKQ
jgi:FMN phosphatase YigB (HAD superfamily)